MANLYNKAGLINIPVGYSDGFLYNIKPTDNTLGFRFDRASAATRVNEKGLIEQVGYFGPELVQNGNFSELGPELIINGDFATDSDWSKLNATISDGKGNLNGDGQTSLLWQDILTNGKTYKATFTVLDYNELGEARLINNEGTAIYTITSNGTFTIYFTHSIANGYLLFRARNGAVYSIDNVSVKEVDPNDRWDAEGFGTNFSITNQLNLLETSTSGGAGIFQAATITSGKTYRIKFDVTAATGSTIFAFQFCDNKQGGNTSFSSSYCDSVGSFEFTTEATQDNLGFRIRYAKGTGKSASIDNISVVEVLGDKPRIDYTDSLTSPSFLLEPQSTNSILYSNGFENSAWQKAGNGVGFAPVVSANQGISPDGTDNAFKIDFDLNGGTTSSDRSRLTQNFTNTLTTDYTFSFYAKAYSQSDVGKVLNCQADNVTGEDFNFTLTSDWQKFTTKGQSNGNNIKIHIQLRGTYNNSDTASLLLFGFQAEAGSYATSYIPTAGSTVTRAAETCNGAGNASTFNSTEGVLYAEIAALADTTSQEIAISLSEGQIGANRLLIRMKTNGVIGAVLRVANTTQASIDSGSLDQSTSHKIAVKYKLNDIALWIDGIEVGTDNLANVFPANTLDEASFNQGNNSNNFYGKVKGIYAFNKALTDDELQQLTGPDYNSFAALAAAYNYTVI